LIVFYFFLKSDHKSSIMQGILGRLGKLGESFLLKSEALSVEQKALKSGYESAGLVLSGLPKHYEVYAAHKTHLWRQIKTGNITVNEFTQLLTTGAIAAGAFTLGEVIGRRNFWGYRGSERSHDDHDHDHHEKHDAKHEGKEHH
jgi:hypothetical protein